MTNPDVEIPPSAYGMAFPLAWVTGYVDAVGFLTLAGLFVAHMSGNAVRLGVFVGGDDWSLATQRFVPIVAFILGVVGGIAFVEALRRRSIPVPARVLGIEAALLLVFMLAGRAVVGSEGASAGSWDYYLLAIVVVLAMALPNVALRRVAGLPVHTTFVTGMLTYVGEEVVHAWYARRDLRRAGATPHPDDEAQVAFRRARLHGGVWISYFVGGVLGALIALRWDLWSLSSAAGRARRAHRLRSRPARRTSVNGIHSPAAGARRLRSPGAPPPALRGVQA